jgi:hypothetical protein
MELRTLVKYANVTYAGLMLGFTAYFTYLTANQYDFAVSSSNNPIDINGLFNSVNPISAVLIVMIIATVFIVALNMYYENSLQVRVEKRGKSATRRRR